MSNVHQAAPGTAVTCVKMATMDRGVRTAAPSIVSVVKTLSGLIILPNVHDVMTVIIQPRHYTNANCRVLRSVASYACHLPFVLLALTDIT